MVHISHVEMAPGTDAPSRLAGTFDLVFPGGEVAGSFDSAACPPGGVQPQYQILVYDCSS